MKHPKVNGIDNVEALRDLATIYQVLTVYVETSRTLEELASKVKFHLEWLDEKHQISSRLKSDRKNP